MSVKLEFPHTADADLPDRAAEENKESELKFRKINPLKYLASDTYRSDSGRYREFKRNIGAIGTGETDAHRLELLREQESLIQGCITGMDGKMLSTVMDRIFSVVSAMIAVWGAVDVISSGGLNLIAVLVMGLLMLIYAVVELLWKSHLRIKELWYQVYLELLRDRIAELKH